MVARSPGKQPFGRGLADGPSQVLFHSDNLSSDVQSPRWLERYSGACYRCTVEIVHVRHASGVDVVLAAVADMYGAFGKLNAYGTTGSLMAAFEDTFYAFKAQLAAFVGYLRTGESPVPFAQTVEMMKIIIAGVRSREDSGRTVRLDEIG